MVTAERRVRAVAVLLPCPACRVGPGSGCVDRRFGVGVQPHADRLRLARDRILLMAKRRRADAPRVGRPPAPAKRCPYTGEDCRCEGSGCQLDAMRAVVLEG